MRLALLIFFCCWRCESQTLQVQNFSGIAWNDGFNSSMFTFPLGSTTVPLTQDFVNAYNADYIALHDTGPISLSGDWLIMVSTNPVAGGIDAVMFSYPLGTLSSPVQVTGANTNSIGAGVMAAFSDWSVNDAWQKGLWFGATVAATLWGFTFIRAIPGGNKEDM